MSPRGSIAAILALLIFASAPAHAHQPRIAFGSRHTEKNPIIVEKPEISKAYYGELRGEPDYYKISSEKPFNLYLNILAPDEKGARTDTRVDLILYGRKVFTLAADPKDWKIFYEHFARDSYVRGPEFHSALGEGVYLVKVYNSDNMGKYALAIGDIESFPIDETIKTAFTLPSIKRHFFNKPAYTAFLNPVGLFLLTELLIALAIAGVAAFAFRFLRKKFPRRK